MNETCMKMLDGSKVGSLRDGRYARKRSLFLKEDSREVAIFFWHSEAIFLKVYGEKLSDWFDLYLEIETNRMKNLFHQRGSWKVAFKKGFLKEIREFL